MSTDETAPEYFQRHIDRLCMMIARVDSLIDLHKFLSKVVGNIRGERPPDPDEALRAAVVLLHAHLEDCLRSAAKEHLSRSDAELLKNMPLAGSSNIHAVKFSLGDLVAHRGKTIDELIDESVVESLRLRSFNNCADLDSILKAIGVDADYCKSRFADLEEMISRRHRIVHECDHLPNSGHPPSLTPIDRETVEKWKDAVADFLKKVFYKLQFIVEGTEEPTCCGAFNGALIGASR